MSPVSDVVFVQMPFAAIQRPSLALGLFTSSLRAAHLSVESIYANIAFAELIDLPSYMIVGGAAPKELFGDWIFAESAFGETARDLGALPSIRSLFRHPDDLVTAFAREQGVADGRALLLRWRQQAREFVDALGRDLVRRAPKVVACTSMFDQHVASLALLQRVKQVAPEILTVIGGANCAGPMGRATHVSFPAVDFTVTGEFDQYVVAFFTALRDASGDVNRVGPLPPGVLGPADRRPAHRLLAAMTPSPTLLNDMDSAATPDYDDYFEQLYSSSIGKYVTSSLPFETSRGCWWGAKQHCTFCGLNAEGMAFRKKSPARALQEIRALTTRYGIFDCFATDNIIDMSYFQTVLPALAADEHPYRIFYETKSNLKREHVKTLADAGCYQIQPGIESLHDETLRIMKKGTTACTNIQLLKYCLEFGIVPAWSILCNFPGSEPEWVADVANDFVGLFHLPPPMGTVPIRFDRFSPYHQQPEHYGLTLEPVPGYRRTYPLDDAVLSDLAYFFQEPGGTDPLVRRHARVSNDMTTRWRSEFWSATRPQLTIQSDDGAHISIRDTRSCAGARTTHELDGRLATLFRVLETPVTRQGLHERIRTAGKTTIDEGELCDLLDDLMSRRLIWRSSTQYVALPTPPPQRPLWEGAIAGDVDVRQYLRESRRLVSAS